MSLKDKVAVVGLGLVALPPDEAGGMAVGDLAILAAQAALDDAGLARSDLQNLAWSSGAGDPGGMAAAMGVPEVSFSANLTSGAGGGAGALGLAASSIVGGFGDVCLSIIASSPAPKRSGTSTLFQPNPVAGGGAYGGPATQQPEDAFWQPAVISSRGATMAMIAERYLHEHGASRRDFGHAVVAQRANAGPTLTLDEYLEAPLVVGPLCAFDGTPELEGAFAAAVITATSERAVNLRQRPVLISAAVTGGTPSHATPFQMPGSSFASSGHRDLATELYAMAGFAPGDIDVALLHDDFSPMVLMQLEDYGFCSPGEAGAFIAGGNTGVGGTVPVNTHGGNLSSAHAAGMTHVFEAVRQLRGDAANQVHGADVALVTGSPATIPLSAAILRRQ